MEPRPQMFQFCVSKCSGGALGFHTGEVSQMEDQCVPEEEDSGDDLMVLSANAAQGTDSTRTVRMVGHVGGKEVIILIDSGSSHTFISEALASRWRDWSPMHTTMQVRVANGQTLQCIHEVQAFPIWISGHAFKMSLKVLPLQCYDIILDMDWLEQHSPMIIDWRKKILSFEYQGNQVFLQGIVPDVVSCEQITHMELATLLNQDKNSVYAGITPGGHQ